MKTRFYCRERLPTAADVMEAVKSSSRNVSSINIGDVSGHRVTSLLRTLAKRALMALYCRGWLSEHTVTRLFRRWKLASA
ncbi:hypothetical protein [Burkholderia ambifaria]|uniref:hypothetical protein n=1 Tax=Burkholderia ambifaria TaxID=152480 RepID=UPI001BA1EB60|nr:hypothetical protein [Burkholderia ambifaria]MBR8179310.1 hypothetical protein [Burkholderia ambifaria]